MALPGVTVKLSALVYPKDQVNLSAGPVGLIEDNLIVPLSSPKTLLNAEVQVVLTKRDELRVSDN